MIDFDVLPVDDDDLDVSFASIESKNVDDSYVIWSMMNSARTGVQQSIYTTPPASFDPSTFKGVNSVAPYNKMDDATQQYAELSVAPNKMDSAKESISKSGYKEKKVSTSVSKNNIVSPEQPLRSGKTKNVGNPDNNQAVRKCNVGFKDVHVRVHEFILCENPACSRGPSIGLGWNYYDMEIDTVDDFERNRCVSRYQSRRRRQEELLLTPGTRVKIAKSLGYTTSDIADVVRRNNKIKHQRTQTILNPGVQKYEEALECATRNMKKILFCINNTADPCDQLCTSPS